MDRWRSLDGYCTARTRILLMLFRKRRGAQRNGGPCYVHLRYLCGICAESVRRLQGVIPRCPLDISRTEGCCDRRSLLRC